MPKVLTDIDVREISAVDEPANPGARVVLFKRKNDMPDKDKTATQKIKDWLAKTFGPAISVDQASIDALTTDLGKAAGSYPPNTDDDEPDEDDNMSKGMTPEDVAKQIDAALAKAKADADKAVEAAVAKAREDAKKDAAAEIEKANKAAAEALEKANKAREELEKANAEAAHRERVAKVKSDFAGLPGLDAEKMAGVFKGLDKDAAEYLTATLKSAAEAVKKGALFVEVGGTNGGELDANSPLGILKAKATEIKKSNASLTEDQAFAKACEANPDIYSQYRNEHRRAHSVANVH